MDSGCIYSDDSNENQLQCTDIERIHVMINKNNYIQFISHELIIIPTPTTRYRWTYNANTPPINGRNIYQLISTHICVIVHQSVSPINDLKTKIMRYNFTRDNKFIFFWDNGKGKGCIIATGDHTFMGCTIQLPASTKGEYTSISEDIKDFGPL